MMTSYRQLTDKVLKVQDVVRSQHTSQILEYKAKKISDVSGNLTDPSFFTPTLIFMDFADLKFLPLSKTCKQNGFEQFVRGLMANNTRSTANAEGP